MFGIFKKMFVYKPCAYADTTRRKIRCMLKNYKFEPYQDGKIYMQFDAMYATIGEYVKVYQAILEHLKDKNEKTPYRVTNYTPTKRYLGYWLTSRNGSILEDPDGAIRIFLEMALEIIDFQDVGAGYTRSGKLSITSSMLQSHITDIDNIVEVLYRSE